MKIISKIPKLARVDRPLSDWIRLVTGKSLTFQLVGTGGESITRVSLFRSQHQRMTVYRGAF